MCLHTMRLAVKSMGGDLKYILGGPIGAKRRKICFIVPPKICFLGGGGNTPCKISFFGRISPQSPLALAVTGPTVII